MKKLVSSILILLLEITLVLNNYQSSVNALENIMNNSKPKYQYSYINPFEQNQDNKYVPMGDESIQEIPAEEVEVINSGSKENNNNKNIVSKENTDTLSSENNVIQDFDITALPTGNCIVVCWNSVANADKYEIEVDGQVIDTDISTNYIHRNLQPNSTHTYRVRAKEGNVYSKWSKAITETSVNKASVNKPVPKENKQAVNEVNKETSTQDKKADSQLQSDKKEEKSIEDNNKAVEKKTEIKTENKDAAVEETKAEKAEKFNKLKRLILKKKLIIQKR